METQCFYCEVWTDFEYGCIWIYWKVNCEETIPYSKDFMVDVTMTLQEFCQVVEPEDLFTKPFIGFCPT